MSNNGNGIENALKAAEKNAVQAAHTLGALRNRVGGQPLNYYSDLVGQDVFLGGHRYHWVGTLVEVLEMATGEAVAVMDNVWQIDYDETAEIKNAFFAGHQWRFPEGCVGMAIQPVSGRPASWQKSWEDRKAKSPAPGA